LDTDLLPEPLEYVIYTPPCYDEEPDRSYPVLYLVHGKDASDSQWVYMGVPDTLDTLVERGQLPPFMVVMPRDRIWTDPTIDKFGQAVLETLLPWIDENYRTLPERKYRAIGGLSRGGAWAIHIGFSHPELFGAVGMHSGVVFGTDVVNVFQWLTSFPDGLTPRVYVDIGDKDRQDILTETMWVESMLTKYDIPHEWHLGKGGHDEIYWKSQVRKYLLWYGQEWLVNQPSITRKLTLG
jgi:enterochelin esterase-like enzyme